MYLSGLIHRDHLFDVATRWLANRVEPADGRIVTEVFTFERTVTAPTVRRFVTDMCRAIQPGPLYLERVSSKDDVREAIVAAAANPNLRIAELIDRYRQLPEDYFPRTPVHMSLVTRHSGRLAALIRRKRIRRIADKVSRRMAAQLAGEIDAVATALVASRPVRGTGAFAAARLDGTPPPGVRGAAERLVADRIRSGRLALDPERQRVDDVIGVKIVGTEAELAKAEAAIDDLDYTFASDREVHDGSYAGTHYSVDLELDPPEQLLARETPVDWSFARGRGLPEDELQSSFRRYVETGSRTFRVELILTTFEDLVESELGASIHEQRILDQRWLANDFSRVSRNASSLIWGRSSRITG